MENKPNYYAIIPADVRYNKNLKDKAKLLYGEITALSNKDGYCYATNNYFAELYGVSNTTISLLIKDLIKNGYLVSEIIYKDNSKEILHRYLRIIKGGYLRNLKEGIKENLKDNNININNTRINKYSSPTLEDIKEYCRERNNNVDPKKFYDYYSVNNWIDNKGNKVKNWKQKIITWEHHSSNDLELPDWFNRDIKGSDPTKKQKKEMEDILKEFK